MYLKDIKFDFILLFLLQGLDEEGSYELFNSFLASDYRGSQKNLQVVTYSFVIFILKTYHTIAQEYELRFFIHHFYAFDVTGGGI